MKKLLPLLLLCALLAGCAPKQAPVSSPDDGKLAVVATLFPQYDFARQIAGDLANITLLLPIGMESHTFEPTPADMIKLQKADLFLYTGPAMEGWAESVIAALPDSEQVVDLSAHIALSASDGDEHDHDVDPHIWTSPKNAKIMADDIAAALISADPENEETYRNNLAALTKQLEQLDQTFTDLVSTAPRHKIYFGGRFAFHYFVQDYGLDYEAAYDSCAEDTEPSVRRLTDMIADMRAESAPVIFYEELTDPKVARSIADETGAEMLLFHSCHNLSKEDFAAGETYISLMTKNAENLRKGLS